MKGCNDAYWEDVSDTQLHSYIDINLGLSDRRTDWQHCKTGAYLLRNTLYVCNKTGIQFLKFKSEIRFSENSADNLYTYFSCHIRSTRQLIIEMGALYRDRYRW